MCNVTSDLLAPGLGRATHRPRAIHPRGQQPQRHPVRLPAAIRQRVSRPHAADMPEPPQPVPPRYHVDQMESVMAFWGMARLVTCHQWSSRLIPRIRRRQRILMEDI